MTLGTIFRSVLGPSGIAHYLDHPTTAHSHKFLSQRNGGSNEYYHRGSYKKHKGKSEKKHAILSALTLLAFLFFLSILQSCIREQNGIRGPTMMFAPTGPTGPTAPTGHQSKDQTPDQAVENPLRKKRSVAAESDEPSNGMKINRKSRSLLGIEEEATNRQKKFIRYYNRVNNWTRELSQMSEKDLEDQKLKTLNLPLYWKNKRFATTELTSTTKVQEAMRGHLLRNKTVPLALRRFKKRERTSSSTEAAKTESMTPTPEADIQKQIWNYKNPPERHHTTKMSFAGQKDWVVNRTQNANDTRPSRREVTSAVVPQLIVTTPATKSTTLPIYVTTPRNRRSEYGSTIRPTDYDEYDRYGEPTREDPQLPPSPAVGLDLNTFQTFPVYNYYNHRNNPNVYRENQTADAAAPEVTEEIDRMHNEVRATTQQPLFHPTRTSPSYSKPIFHDQIKIRNRYPTHQAHHHRNHYPIESRYRYSPYRKAGAYEAPLLHDHFHDDYVVIAKYPQDEEPGFDFMKVFWTMLTSFARPLTKLVPSFAKDNNEEPQCYDLLVCEAQRVSSFMGPTAEALATTVGTLLTWAATEDARQIIVDAINSGRENTCQQQIRDCEGRSGGKSAMTVIAQVMEMRLR